MKKKHIILISCVIVIAVLFVIAFFQGAKVKHTQKNDGTLHLDMTEVGADEAQNYWHASTFTRGNGGYYYLSENQEENALVLKFFDANLKESVYVCGKADCTHGKQDCNAYFSTAEYLRGTLYDYDHAFYMIKVKNGMAVLVKISEDGSAREEVAEVLPNDGNNTITMAFHDGYAYVSDAGAHSGSDKEAVNVLKRVSLKDKTVEDVFSYRGTGTDIGKLKAYGNQLFFIVGGADIDKSTSQMKIFTKMYGYDYQTGNTQAISEEPIYDYCFDEEQNCLYYFVLGEGVYSYSLATKEKTQIKKVDDRLALATLSFDGTYLYIYNGGYGSAVDMKKNIDKTIFVFDRAGVQQRELHLEKDISAVYFGDSQYLFASRKRGGYAYLHKKESWEEWHTFS